MKRAAAYVDLDGTLYRGVALFDALADAFGRVGRSSDYAALMRELDAARASESRVQLNRRVGAALQGWPVADLRRLCAQWHAGLPAERIDNVVTAAVQAHLAAGDEVVLVSASYDAVVAPFAADLGVAYICSDLVSRGGLLTGAVGRVVAGAEKLAVARAHSESVGLSLDDAFAYADHESDAELLAAVGHPVVVGERAGQVWARIHATRATLLTAAGQ